jgi:MATE family multidrug resistance protein
MTAQTQAPPQALTHPRVLKIALPIVLSNITVALLGAVDTGVVGQMGLAAPIGAVGIGAVILGALYWLFGFLRMGTTGLTAQALGAGDRAEVAALLTRALMIAAAAGLLLLALKAPLFAVAFPFTPSSPEVEALARDYLDIRIWSAPAAISIFAINGWLIAQERTRSVLALQIWMNGLNMGLDLWFVLGLGWGVSGVAAATFIAEWSGLALGLWFCRDVLRGAAWRAWERVFDRARLINMALVNRDILIRSLLLEAMIVSFMFFGAGFGDQALAANQLLLQFLMITAYGMDGFAFAAETLGGQAIGARQRAALRRAAELSGIWGLGVGIFAALAFWAGGGLIIDVMTTAEDVRAAARIYLPWMVVMPALSAAAWILDGVFIGATATRDMRNMMVLSFAAYAAALALFLPWLGNHGLWLALIIGFTARGITLAVRYPALEARAAA